MNYIIASGPVIIEDGKVLLNISGQDDFWKFCGGKMKEGDVSFSATVKRRAHEEMGLDVTIAGIEPFAFYVIRKSCDGKSNVEVILLHFLAERKGDIVAGEGVKDYRWFTAEELAREKLAPNILPTLKHFGFIDQ